MSSRWSTMWHLFKSKYLSGEHEKRSHQDSQSEVNAKASNISLLSGLLVVQMFLLFLIY